MKSLALMALPAAQAALLFSNDGQILTVGGRTAVLQV